MYVLARLTTMAPVVGCQLIGRCSFGDKLIVSAHLIAIAFVGALDGILVVVAGLTTVRRGDCDWVVLVRNCRWWSFHDVHTRRVGVINLSLRV